MKKYIFSRCPVLLLILLTNGVFNNSLFSQGETGFYIYSEETSNEDVAAVLNFISEDQELLFELVEDLNDFLEIPVAVPIVFTDCGIANAFYDPEQQAVFMCYEMLVESFKIYSQYEMTEEDLSLAVADNLFSIMYHEIGHALVDLLELPITGREEDAVDQFSVMSLLEFDDLGQEALVNFALFWGGLASQGENELEKLAFWGEHSLSSQRFYDILCLAYGADNEGLSHLVENGVLPESRAVRCEGEFDRVANAWYALLEPHIKE